MGVVSTTAVWGHDHSGHLIRTEIAEIRVKVGPAPL